ncbi:hypothetical protein CORC01_12969 [Colletotrichum orchidophilum]|uniref:F-box domain-containing protein n=1 Tax=Colletotrichum orchidophilum TaxID=1209926 RepID=A0A1G4ARU5_9PEZI|nr:uncharacterized protein CORC01_12969 [Colletotrichum orchidophilum]OHE91742.1 hypothetical protein CORC01_12969 [Colletotrichum orchidophilum]
MQRLSHELLLLVANLLSPEDLWNLSLVCKKFVFLMHDESCAKTILEDHAPFSTEMRDARPYGNYARAFRRRAKVRDAVTMAEPYLAAVVAHANEYIYCNGMLCYTQIEARKLCLHSIHQSAPKKIEISVDRLLASMLQTPPAQKYKFRPIHFSDNILSCLYIPRENTGSKKLFVIDIEKRRSFLPKSLHSCKKPFVRNNQEYLYYGAYDDDDKWKLKVLSLSKDSWLPGLLVLDDLAGFDVGITLAFEIVDDHFYAVSTVPKDEPEGTGHLSRYHGVRYPLGMHNLENKQLMSESMFRRDHRDGPMDNRWTTLSLEKDSKTGVLEVVECRREYSYNGNGKSRAASSSRTAYRTAVDFYNDEPADDSVSIGEGIEQESVQVPGFQDQTPRSHGSPSTFHRGDDSFTEPLITFNNCFVRSYNSPCGAFLDLINPAAVGEKPTSLQLRSMTRLQAATHKQPDSRETNHIENVISYWTLQMKADGESKKLADTLIPHGQDSQWEISGVADDRSLIYISGNTKTKNLRPLVLISFDPSIKLPGVLNWLGAPLQNTKGVEVKPHPDAPANQGG